LQRNRRIIAIHSRRISVFATTKKPRKTGAFRIRVRLRLLDRGGNVRERGVHVGAQRLHGADDDDRDTSSDQAVFNGGRARLVLDETSEKILHGLTPYPHVAV